MVSSEVGYILKMCAEIEKNTLLKMSLEFDLVLPSVVTTLVGAG